ncbi:hypothetical protein WJX74_003688 [Apatococcus lobatus]|uniref:SGNH hydrolase-type esterase domain-containing protein n=1 Tax=Apatococcus lobatus TaxID=904363 RepID=A0AAW1RBX0_9CHLO
MSRPEFVLFGDSLTQQSFESGGWGAALADAYSRRVDVINRGFSGYNSRWAEPLLARALQHRETAPIFLSIWLGANDAALPDRLAAFQHIPVDEYQTILQQMVKDARAGGAKSILLITPPPVDDAARVTYNQQAEGLSEASSQPERTNASTEQYAAACKAAGKAAGTPVLDMFSKFPDGSHDWKERYFTDGLHFTPAGQQRVYLLLVECMAKHFPELRAASLAMDYPDFMQVEAADPFKSILGASAFKL